MDDEFGDGELWLASDGKWYPPTVLNGKVQWGKSVATVPDSKDSSVLSSVDANDPPDAHRVGPGALLLPVLVVASVVIVVVAGLLVSGGAPKGGKSVALDAKTSTTTSTSTKIAPTTSSSAPTASTTIAPAATQSTTAAQGSSSGGSVAPQSSPHSATPAPAATVPGPTPSPVPAPTTTTTQSPRPEPSVANPYPENQPASFPDLFVPSISFSDADGDDSDWHVSSATLTQGAQFGSLSVSLPSACRSAAQACAVFNAYAGDSGEISWQIAWVAQDPDGATSNPLYVDYTEDVN